MIPSTGTLQDSPLLLLRSVRRITDFSKRKPQTDFWREVCMTTSKVTPMLKTHFVSRPAGLEERIRCRAYQLYEEHGKKSGQALNDWLAAEAEILSHQVRRKAC
jgi:hypothetical protein